MTEAENLFANVPTSLPEELVEVLAENQHVRIERIVSTGHVSPEGFWYDQRLHSGMFGISAHELDVIFYCGMGLLKLGVILFFFFPWIAIRIVLGYDVVLMQELVAPPFTGRYPNGTVFDADQDSVEFFQAMADNGFDFVLSEEDTGTNPEIHSAGPGTEWWAAFFKPNVVEIATDLPGGFLAKDRSDHPDFERVPYAFPFRSTGGETDFVLISVHLQPGSSGASRRAEEFEAIFSWIDANNSVEKDFLVVGDMNIHSEDELTVWESAGWLSLNNEMRKTNTSPGSDQAYDHVLYDPRHSTEVDEHFDLVVVDLVEEMRGRWTSSDPYPGDPYDGNLFGQYYSDHHPVVFRMALTGSDDD